MSDYYKALLERAETDLNCRFISEDFVLGCSITAELIKDLTETMVALEAIRVSKDKRIAELEAKIDAVVEYKVIIEKALQLASKAIAAIEALQPASGGE